MAAIRIESFQGMLPKESDRLLPQNAASFAENCRLYSGEIRSFPALSQPQVIFNYGSTATSLESIFKVVDTANGKSGWVALDDPLAKVVRSPVHNDSKGRYYMTYRTKSGTSSIYQAYASDMLSSDWIPEKRIGMPIPTISSATVIDGSTASTAKSEVYYTATLVDVETGAEGQPSDPFLVTTDVGKSLSVDFVIKVDLLPADGDTSDYAVVLYRTIVGNTSAIFKRIYPVRFGRSGELDVHLSSVTLSETSIPKPIRLKTQGSGDTYVEITVKDFLDTTATKPRIEWTTEYVLSQPTLATASWTNPPDLLEGLTNFPNGFLVAFKGRDLYFSVPFHPHAWPDEYKKTLPDSIVAIAPLNQSVVVFTTSHTYILTGTSPASIRETKLPRIAPCISPRAIVSSELGVVYPADDGLMLVNQSGMQMLTEKVLKKFQWQKYSSPNMTAVIDGYRYLAYYDQQQGFYVDLIDPRQWFSEINVYSDVKSIVQDPITGSPAFLIGESVFLWDSDYSVSLPFKWKSKEFSLPKAINLGAAKLELSGDSVAIKTAAQPRYKFKHLPLAGNMIAGTPIAGYSMGAASSVTDGEVLFRVYADGNLVYSKKVDNEEIMRLPSGFKSAVWSFEISGLTPVYSIHIAETAKGLANA